MSVHKDQQHDRYNCQQCHRYHEDHRYCLLCTKVLFKEQLHALIGTELCPMLTLCDTETHLVVAAGLDVAARSQRV